MTASCNGMITGPKRPHCSSIKSAFRRLALLAALLVPLVSCSLHTPSASPAVDIRNKIFDAYGGGERLSQISSIAAEGSITALARGDHGVYRRALRRDGKLFVDILYSESRETRILNGTRALRGIDGKLEDVRGPGISPWYTNIMS